MILAQDGLLIIQLKTHLHEVGWRKKKSQGLDIHTQAETLQECLEFSLVRFPRM